MMNSIGAGTAKWRGVGLVRDSNGLPKIDDPKTCPAVIWDALTSEEKAHVLTQYFSRLSVDQKELIIRRQ